MSYLPACKASLNGLVVCELCPRSLLSFNSKITEARMMLQCPRLNWLKRGGFVELELQMSNALQIGLHRESVQPRM